MNDEIALINSLWETLVLCTLLIIIYFTQPFTAKKWLMGAIFLWLIASIIYSFKRVLMLFQFESFTPLTSHYYYLANDLHVMALNFFFIVFLLSLWASKRLNMDAGNLMFSFKGRIPRIIYWAVNAILVSVNFNLIASLVNTPTYSGEDSPRLITMIYYTIVIITMLWVTLAVSIKRWHDCNKSGWFVLLNFIPGIGSLIGLFYLGCVRGTKGENNFGIDPLLGRSRSPKQPCE